MTKSSKPINKISIRCTLSNSISLLIPFSDLGGRRVQHGTLALKSFFFIFLFEIIDYWGDVVKMECDKKFHSKNIISFTRSSLRTQESVSPVSPVLCPNCVLFSCLYSAAVVHTESLQQWLCKKIVWIAGSSVHSEDITLQSTTTRPLQSFMLLVDSLKKRKIKHSHVLLTPTEVWYSSIKRSTEPLLVYQCILFFIYST